MTFDFKTFPHTVQTASHVNADPINITKDPNGAPGDINQAIPAGQQRMVTVQGSSGGKINFQCGIHLFQGTINISWPAEPKSHDGYQRDHPAAA